MKGWLVGGVSSASASGQPERRERGACLVARPPFPGGTAGRPLAAASSDPSGQEAAPKARSEAQRPRTPPTALAPLREESSRYFRWKGSLSPHRVMNPLQQGGPAGGRGLGRALLLGRPRGLLGHRRPVNASPPPLPCRAGAEAGCPLPAWPPGAAAAPAE